MNNKYTNNTGMLDILFCMLMFFFIIAVLEAFIIRIEDNKKNVESTAEFLITMTWPDGQMSDIDLYIEDPLGNIVFFGQKVKGLMHLERDDLGSANDIVINPDGTINYIMENIEIATIRGIIAGEYTVNIHAYNLSANSKKRDGTVEPGSEIVKVKVKIEKLNPYSIVSLDNRPYKEIEITHNGQEHTVLRFTLSSDGEVSDVNDLEKKFVNTARIVR